MHGDGLADDEAISYKFADGLARVGIGDLAGLVGIKPDLALSASDDRGSQTLLGSEVDPIEMAKSALVRGDDNSEGLGAPRLWAS